MRGPTDFFFSLSRPDDVKGILDELLCACIDIIVVTPLSELCDSIYDRLDFLLRIFEKVFRELHEVCYCHGGLFPHDTEGMDVGRTVFPDVCREHHVISWSTVTTPQKKTSSLMEDDVKGSFARRCHYPSWVSSVQGYYIRKMSGKDDQSEGLHHLQIAIQYNPPDHILSFLDE